MTQQGRTDRNLQIRDYLRAASRWVWAASLPGLLFFSVGASAQTRVAAEDAETAQVIPEQPVAPLRLALADIRQGADLAKQYACLACHQVDVRRVGPPFLEIGRRYASSSNMEETVAYLADTIRKGGKGRWGAIPMPAQPRVGPGEARILAEWILSFAQEEPSP